MLEMKEKASPPTDDHGEITSIKTHGADRLGDEGLVHVRLDRGAVGDYVVSTITSNFTLSQIVIHTVLEEVDGELSSTINNNGCGDIAIMASGDTSHLTTDFINLLNGLMVDKL